MGTILQICSHDVRDVRDDRDDHGVRGVHGASQSQRGAPMAEHGGQARHSGLVRAGNGWQLATRSELAECRGGLAASSLVVSAS